MTPNLYRPTDPETSRLAADSIAPHISRMQQMVLEAFETHGPMTSKELRMLPRFDGYEESSSRGRIPELIKKGLLIEYGKKKNVRGNKMMIYATKPKGMLF